MSRDVIVVPPELSLSAAWRILRREQIRHLPVVRAGALIGMLSDRDVLQHGAIGKDGDMHFHEGTIVGEAMTPTPVVTCEPTTDVSWIAEKMVAEKIDAIPVVRGLRLVGLVTSTDLLLLLIHKEEKRPLPFDYRLVEDARAYA